MASVKVVLRIQKVNAKSEAPLALRITKDRKASFLFIDCRIEPRHWDAVECRVRKSHRNSQRLNNYITSKLAEAQARLLEQLTDHKDSITTDIREHIKGKAPVSFFSYADRYLAGLEVNQKVGTYRKSKAIIGKMRNYMKGKELMFNQLTVSWLTDYERYLIGTMKNKKNTVASNFRTIRIILNQAINEGVVDAGLNPFKRYRLKTEKAEKEFLTAEEVELLEAEPLVKGSRKELHRDMFLFSVSAGGLRISDVLMLRWEHCSGDRLCMKTQKTGSIVAFKLPHKAIDIMNKYKGPHSKPASFVFPILSDELNSKDPRAMFNARSSATAYANKDIRAIAQKVGLEKRISFHTARHTFATLALKRDIPLVIVSKLMGHSGVAITEGYARIVNADLDKAMEAFN